MCGFFQENHSYANKLQFFLEIRENKAVFVLLLVVSVFLALFSLLTFTSQYAFICWQALT